MLIPKRVIDNSQVKLSDFLSQVLAATQSPNLDIATAFFNIKAYELVQEEIDGIKKFRLLLGKSPELIKEITLGEKLLCDVKKEIEGFNLEKSQEALVKKFIDFLRKDNVQVRIYHKDFLHGKAYIFDDLVVVGSSNFTRAGLTSNTELNVVSLESEAAYIRREWFDKFWEQAEDFKEELLAILENSRFGSREYSPYQVFIKTLYELQKDDFKSDHEKEVAKDEYIKTRVNLAEFQEDAVKRVFSRLRKYGVVLVADSVGLGKTWIAKKIIEEFGFYKRKNFLLICPAQIKEMWTNEIKDLRLSENILTQESLALENYQRKALRTCGGDFDDISLVVVDESHNFRNPLSNRWENLFNLLEKINQKNGSKPYILFLTATPINNTLWDLYWQIILMVHSNQRTFLKQGIANLFEYFKEIEKKQDPRLLNDLLNEISIRRTRNFIKDNYPKAEVNGKRIIFPDRILENVEYQLDQAYQGMYKEISDIISSKLTMAYYRILEYKKVEKLSAEEDMALGRMIALEGIFKTILLKRLESSVRAFCNSINRHIYFLEKLKVYLKKGKLLQKKAFNKYIIGLDEEESEKIIEILDNIDLNDFDQEKLFTDIEKDINLFRKIHEKVSAITPDKDAKLLELKEMLLKLLSQKEQIVIFTYYADTLEYLADNIQGDKRFKKYNIERISGRVPSSRREKIVESFFEKKTDLLISTDVLSEGMNLQTAKYLINYDLHWNPTRMIQRAGRIDRIGSPFREIFVYNFFPEKELEDLLRLVAILQDKIIKIDSSVGLDQTILGEKIHPKVFGAIRRIKEKDNTLFDELENDVFGGGESFYQPLRNFLKKKGTEEIDKWHDGIHSGLINGIRGIFYYYKYGDDFHFWYLYDFNNLEFIKNKTKILDFIACQEDEKRVIPDFFDEVYRINKLVIEDIESTHKTLELQDQDAPTKDFSKDRRSSFINKMIHEVEMELDDYLLEFPEDDEIRNKWDTTLEKLRSLHPTPKRLRELRRIWRKYKEHKHWKNLVSDLENYTKSLPDFDMKDDQLEPFDPNKLRLICIDFIS